ncbi:MAG: Na(+)-translocating NADH-quinone reductase subunit C [Planctomycetota bacterium]
MPQPNQTFRTLQVAAVLCIACSAVVSLARVGLLKQQEDNKVLDRQKNILDAAGLSTGEFGQPASELSREQIEELYAWVEEELIDLETGETVTDMDVAAYDAREAAAKDETSVPIGDVEYNPGVPRREKIAKVYKVKRPGSDQQLIVLPVYGKGLWSTLYGYLALKGDLNTIQGLTFYEHAETPGLGGEVDNPKWKAQWEDKKLFDSEGDPAAIVFKGTAPRGDIHAVDGLSGATITSRGVTVLIRYWAGENGYGNYLKKLKNANTNSQTAGI